MLKFEHVSEHPELNLALDMTPDDIIGGLRNSLAPGNAMMTSNKLSGIGNTILLTFLDLLQDYRILSSEERNYWLEIGILKFLYS